MLFFSARTLVQDGRARLGDWRLGKCVRSALDCVRSSGLRLDLGLELSSGLERIFSGLDFDRCQVRAPAHCRLRPSVVLATSSSLVHSRIVVCLLSSRFALSPLHSFLNAICLRTSIFPLRYSGVSNLRGTRSGYRLVVSNMAPRTSWQDLKDFAREAGSVRFTDVWVEKGKKYGVIEYASRDDYEEALRKLDDTKLDGNRIRLKPENSRDRSSSRSRSASRSRGRRSRSRSGSRSRSRSRRTRRRSSDRRRDRSKSRSLSRDRKRSPSRDRKRSPSKPKSPVKNNTKEEQPPASADANAPANNTPPAESARAKSASPGKSPARASPPRAD